MLELSTTGVELEVFPEEEVLPLCVVLPPEATVPPLEEVEDPGI